jgi:hypothetical protein
MALYLFVVRKKKNFEEFKSFIRGGVPKNANKLVFKG